jgi:DNA polymerase III delta prime subunit
MAVFLKGKSKDQNKVQNKVHNEVTSKDDSWLKINDFDTEDNLLKFNSNDTRELPWVEKYRPKEMEEIKCHEAILESLNKSIEKKMLPHLLFFGPPGSGKTTTAICCASKIYGKFYETMILRLNASYERGIDIIRNKVIKFILNNNNMFMSNKRKNIYKWVILDEIDSMTIEAQGMLRKTIEQYSHKVRFCLLCNEIDKVNEALQSRCTLYRFSPLIKDMMKDKLTDICANEKIKYDTQSLNAIIKISHGDMRSAINWLQIICLSDSNKKLNEEKIYKMAGFCSPAQTKEIFSILDSLYNKKTSLCDAVNCILKIIDSNNLSLFNVLEELRILLLNNKWKDVKKLLFILDHFGKIEISESINVQLKCSIRYLCSLFVTL